MKKLIIAVFILIIFVLAGCGVSETAKTEQNEDIMAELTEVYDAMENGDAKDIVEKLMSSPTVITRHYGTVNNKYDQINAYNTEVAPYQDLNGCKLELILDPGEYTRYFSTYFEENEAGGVRVHYLTVISEITEDGILKQPLHAFAYHRILEKHPAISADTQLLFNNRFYEVGAYKE